jgi:hypothetical protein
VLLGCLKQVAQEAVSHQNSWVPIQQERMEEIYQGLREELRKEQTEQLYKDVRMHNEKEGQDKLRFCSCNVEPEILERLENLEEGSEMEELEQKVWKQYRETIAERRGLGKNRGLGDDGREKDRREPQGWSHKESGPQHRCIQKERESWSQVWLREEEGKQVENKGKK